MKKQIQEWLQGCKRKADRESVGFCVLGALVLVGGFLMVSAAKESFTVPMMPVSAEEMNAPADPSVTTAPVYIAAETTTTATSYLYESIPVTDFTVSDLAKNVVSALDYTRWFYSEYEECRYLCLPAVADRAALTISYTAAGTLYLNDVAVESGKTTDLLSTADVFSLRVGDTDCGTLKVLQSDLGSIFLSTQTGGLDFVDTSKANSDSGDTLMFNADGTVEYLGSYDKIDGRGNSSWDYSKKKSYNLKMPKKTDLFGLGKAKKWALLSNYLDHTHIRNSVAMALSQGSGLEYTMDSIYVDLYADGEYRGTYQLFERVQIQSQRVDIVDLEEETEAVNTVKPEDCKIISSNGVLKTCERGSYRYRDVAVDPADITGGYLIEFQTSNRYEAQTDVCGFVTTRGQCVQFKDPENPSKAQVLYVRQFVQEMEDAIYAEDGYNAAGKHYSQYIDVDDFMRAYLIQEITSNADGSYTSFFFWKESDLYGDGKFHCGPVWDFDLAYANFARVVDGHGCCNPLTLYAAHLPVHRQFVADDGLEVPLGWLGTMYQKEEYYADMVKCYFEVFEPMLLELCDETSATGMAAMGQSLSASVAMNNALWNMLGKNKPLGPVNGYTYEECIGYLDTFLTKRQGFLSGLWLPEAKNQAVQSLQAVYDALPLERYDADALDTLSVILADGFAAIEAAESYSEVTSAGAAAADALQAVCTRYCFGDFTDNGVVDTIDVISMLQHYTAVLNQNAPELTAVQLQNCDTNADGKIDTVDAVVVLQYIVEQLMQSEQT